MAEFVERPTRGGARWPIWMLALLAVAAGCNRDGAKTNVKTGDSAAAATALAGPAPMVAGLKGTPSRDRIATRTYLYSLAWADDDSDAGVQYDWPLGGSQTALIRAVATRHANGQSWHTATVPNDPMAEGHFVAKIYNLENKAIPALGLAANDDVVYVWVGQRENTTPGVGMYTLRGNGAVRSKHHLSKRFGYCGGNQYPTSLHFTNGMECPEVASVGSFIHLAARQDTALQPGGQGLWVSCRGGCCEIKPQ